MSVTYRLEWQKTVETAVAALEMRTGLKLSGLPQTEITQQVREWLKTKADANKAASLNLSEISFVSRSLSFQVTRIHPSDDPLPAYNLAARCIVEAAAEGIALEEINTATDSLETQIFDAMAHLAEPGTPGD